MSGGELPPWMNGKPKKKKINSRSAKQERDYAKQIGGKVQAGSGSSPRAPQDVVGPVAASTGEGFLVELKFTDGKGYRITGDDWLQYRANAHRDGRSPKLIIDLERYGIRLAVVEE